MTQTEQLREQILSQKPTDQQRDAIFADELEFLLRASPGSGKTWTSCRRFIWRGANWHHKAGGLALLSFTNAAIREFHEATIKVGRRELLSNPNYVGTFDSFVERFIITPFGHLKSQALKRPKLFLAPRPGDRKNKKLQGWTETNAGRKFSVPAWEIVPFLTDDGKVKYKASKDFGEKTLEFRWGNPVSEFFKLGFYTHGQRVYLACSILFDRPHIAACLARRFPEIIVDEAQDTNVWLLVLMNLLRKNGTKVTLVGDPDQCIYEFSMADATFLPALKEQWNIPEKPLSRSFRCNNHIAHAVRNIVGNTVFEGCGQGKTEHCKPYIVREPNKSFGRSVSEFDALLERTKITQDASVVLCRAHHQLESIRGDVNYNDLQGITKQFALAAFFRDVRRDYSKALQLVENSIREIVDEPEFWDGLEDDPESEDSMRIKLTIWRFTKCSDGLPIIETNGTEWVDQLKANLSIVLKELQIKNLPKLGLKIRRTGLDQEQLALPLFRQQTLFSPIRHETIHQVKGESIDCVLLLGSTKFFNSVVKAIDAGENTEERRLAYVAMTRARHALLVGLPASHYDNHAEKWINWGFTAI